MESETILKPASLDSSDGGASAGVKMVVAARLLTLA